MLPYLSAWSNLATGQYAFKLKLFGILEIKNIMSPFNNGF